LEYERADYVASKVPQVTLASWIVKIFATSTGLGFERGALVFAALIALVAAAHYFTSISSAVLFCAGVRQPERQALAADVARTSG
jgi:uncharacterized membrane-anchored protein